MRTLYFDLDGTILDVSSRLHSVYLDIVNQLGGEPLSKEVYWQAKKEQLSEDTIAKKSKIDNTSKYMQLRKERIELPKYLKHDKLIPRALESLSELKKDNQMVLVTLRNSTENLHQQLRRFKIEPLFDKVLVGSNGKERWSLKAKIIRSDNLFEPRKAIIIGDTEADILAGKNLNMLTIAVLSGIRGRKELLSSQPDYIINDITQLRNAIDNFSNQF